MEKNFINLAGEFLVAAELNRRSILCSVTYGASKRADLFAFTETTGRVVRIEVKATVKEKWPVGERGKSAGLSGADHVWVFVLLPTPLDAPTLDDDAPTFDDSVRCQHTPRFFVLTASQVGNFIRASYDDYSRRYKEKHGVPYSQLGVPSITLKQASVHESKWDKVRNALLG